MSGEGGNSGLLEFAKTMPPPPPPPGDSPDTSPWSAAEAPVEGWSHSFDSGKHPTYSKPKMGGREGEEMRTKLPCLTTVGVLLARSEPNTCVSGARDKQRFARLHPSEGTDRGIPRQRFAGIWVVAPARLSMHAVISPNASCARLRWPHSPA